MLHSTKTLLVGFGHLGQMAAKFILEKGGTLIGVVTRSSNKGKDVGDLLQLGKKLNVTISNNLKETLEKKPDIALLVTSGSLQDQIPIIEQVASYKVDVISINDDIFYPRNQTQELFKKIDEIAKKNNISVVGTGLQDVYWGHLATTLAGSVHKIKSLEGKFSCNVDHPDLHSFAQSFGTGLSIEQFEKEFSGEKNNFSVAYIVQWLAVALGLKEKSISMKYVPIVLDKPIYSEALKREIPKGFVIGSDHITILNTEEGPSIEFHSVGKVYSPNEKDEHHWIIRGTPSVKLNYEFLEDDGVDVTTVATMVNRIPQVISARPGYVPSFVLDCPKYLNKL